MIRPSEIRKKVEKKYMTFLSSLITAESFFPLEISFAKVKSSETLSSFSTLKKELAKLREFSDMYKDNGYSVDYMVRRDRKIGDQSFPVRIYFSNSDQFTAYLGRKKETLRFLDDIKKILFLFPVLKDWIINNPHLVVRNNGLWDQLLKVCLFFDQNPCPKLYIRELPIEVDTKFIENNKPVLRKLLDIILDGRVFADTNHFESRYGLKYNEPLIRMRILDSKIAETYFGGVDDLSVPLSQFKTLLPECNTVFILENIFNFLTFPKLTGTIAIFGSGFKVGLLKDTHWLDSKKTYYWGDIDTHGFQILSQIRYSFPQIVSFLMDRKTFDSFKKYHVDGVETAVKNPEHLTREEQSLYRYLYAMDKKNRLEQEKIPQKFVVNELNFLLIS